MPAIRRTPDYVLLITGGIFTTVRLVLVGFHVVIPQNVPQSLSNKISLGTIYELATILH